MSNKTHRTQSHNCSLWLVLLSSFVFVALAFAAACSVGNSRPCDDELSCVDGYKCVDNWCVEESYSSSTPPNETNPNETNDSDASSPEGSE